MVGIQIKTFRYSQQSINSNMKLLQLVIIFVCLVYVSQGALKTEEFISEENFGEYANTIQAKNQYVNLPAQYYICGFSFQEEILYIDLRNCKCGMYWYRWRRRYGCDVCPNQFRIRAVGFSTVFCHYNKWSDQIVKSFNTGSGSAGNWRDRVMCPIGYYATGFNGKYGSIHNRPTGLHGLLLTCTTPDYKNSQQVQDSQPNLRNHFQAKHGNFLSSYRMKYTPGQILSGIRFYAEGMPTISDVKITYQTSAGFEDYPVTIDSQIVSNCDKNTAQKKVGFTKKYDTTGQWNSENPQMRGYEISSNVTVAPPSLVNNKNSGIGGPYKFTSGVFGFQSPVKTVLDSSQEILVFVSGQTQSRVSTIVQQQKGSIPYRANLTISNKNTGEHIMNYAVTGTWVGVTTSSVRTDIYSTPANCITETPQTPEKKEDKKAEEKPNLRS